MTGVQTCALPIFAAAVSAAGKFQAPSEVLAAIGSVGKGDVDKVHAGAWKQAPCMFSTGHTCDFPSLRHLNVKA